MRQLERAVLLQVVDQRWKEHLFDMDKLKEGIGLRAYGQKDPLLEYKREGYEMFVEMIEEIKREVVQLLLKIQAYHQPNEQPRPSQETARWREYRPEVTPTLQAVTPAPVFAGAPVGAPPAFGSGPRDMTQAVPTGGKAEPVRRSHPKIGRNDPCYCGSGKKYKKCHGANG
jgi:preprotein translocase subunit SecA